MKFGVVCDVEGKTYLENGGTIENEGCFYKFYVTDEGLLKQIRIISAVDDPTKYFYIRHPAAADGTVKIDCGYEEHIKDNLISELQRLESTLALIGNIKRVYWNKPTFEYYPETTEEHARFNILPIWFFLHESTTDDPTSIEANALVDLIRHRDLFQPLVVPMAFYREAKTEYSNSRYINAFFNAYFIIEGLFGDGKWKSDAVIEALTKSTVFRAFVQNFLDDVAANDDPAEGMTRTQLEGDLKARGHDYTAEGLIKLLIRSRGDLHHFSIGSTKAQGTPLNNADYKRLALMAFKFAGDSLTYHLRRQAKDH